MSEFMNGTEHFGLVAAGRQEDMPAQSSKTAEKVWAEQTVLISSLTDSIAVDDFGETPSGRAGDFATFGKEVKTADVTQELAWVKAMKDSGALKIALDHLSTQSDSGPSSKAVSAEVIVKVAQLKCIMNSCVYQRDVEAEKSVHEIMKPFADKIKDAKIRGTPLDKATQNAISSAVQKVDQITSQIQRVATAMGLKYQPLCNFSSEGTLLRSGPYCGAFYRQADVTTKTKAMMVLAFKGTGKTAEYITDLRFKMKSVSDVSPLKGHCHSGFFDGIFKNFVSDLAVNGGMPDILPFQLLRNQIFRLSKEIAGTTNPQPVQGHSLGAAYATICWQGLLATQAKVTDKAYRDLFTFGSPRVGDEINAKSVKDIRTNQRSWRFDNGKDGVPTVPLYVSGWRHLDTLVKISPAKIALGPSELSGKTPETIPEGSLLPFRSDHELQSYWKSLTTGKIFGSNSWKPETISDRPETSANRLVTWTLHADQRQESVVDRINPDDAISGKESLFFKYKRHRVDVQDFKDGGKYRSVVKIQSLWRHNNESFWTMGTGWLIRDDLVVTAGHNIYSDTYHSQALRVKCWVGYCGRDLVNKSDVQHRNGLNIATTKSWYSHSSEPGLRDMAMGQRRDVAMIQVDAPFTGNLRPFEYISTPSPQKNGSIVVVGYPGDKHPERNEEDVGGWMFEGRCPARYDLAKDSHMIEYEVDTYGGQSGAPVLLSDDEGTVAIGTHCYGGSTSGPFNLGNPIGGKYGNTYDEVRNRFKPSTSKTVPLGTFTPKLDPTKSNLDGHGEKQREPKPEGFWPNIKTIRKIGSAAAPVVGTLGGPIGTLFGTIAGGIIGAFAESARMTPGSESFSMPQTAKLYACFQRAQCAEATLQSALRLDRSGEAETLWTKVKDTWNQHQLRDITSTQFLTLASPIFNDYGYRLASRQWQNGVDPNPAAKHVKAGKDGGTDLHLTKPESINPSTAGFTEAFFGGHTPYVEGSEKESAEFMASWLSNLGRGAIGIARPIASDFVKRTIGHVIGIIGGGSNAESMPADAQDDDLSMALQRAVVADCVMQTVERMDKQELEALTLMPGSGAGQEGFMDSLKIAIQRGGPLLIDIANATVGKHLPGIIKGLNQGKRNASYIYEVREGHGGDAVPVPVDHVANPDAPTREPGRPVTPALPREPSPPVEWN